MLSRSRFFFSGNPAVLRTLSQTKGCRPCLAGPPKASLFPRSSQWMIRFWNSVVSKRSLTTNLGPRNGGNGLPSGRRMYTTLSVKPKPVFAENSPKGRPSNIISDKVIGYWLVGTSGLIFGIVVLGGLTRLTESGLSITEWRPVTGTLPPMNEQEWLVEFTKYQDSPEFKLLNSHITLDEFKFIYSMEWGHRLVGRVIGMVFILPGLYFWGTGRLNARTKRLCFGLTLLLGLQGAIGWWMVQSGLDEQQLSERNSKPTVSQYRLTTHLGAAFLLYLGVLWSAFEFINENRWLKQATKAPEQVQKVFSQLSSAKIAPVRAVATALLGLTFITALSGGMVAGLDAGLIYNTFPHMGDDYLPTSGELMSPVFARKEDLSDLWWRNLLENPTTVQLVHRIFATTTFFAILAAHSYVIKKKQFIPRPAQRALHGMMGLVSLQVTLGISTLLYLVPIPLAAAHQAGALALLTGCILFSARLKRPRPQAVAYINEAMKKALLK
ncbi:Cytochrome c oxidase assembly protein COX15 [Meyerozyma sp. JA9]|nr:Cytochrome c oxidase assembly protein COX15 [Meyerozyma sp. JA9]